MRGVPNKSVLKGRDSTACAALQKLYFDLCQGKCLYDTVRKSLNIIHEPNASNRHVFFLFIKKWLGNKRVATLVFSKSYVIALLQNIIHVEAEERHSFSLVLVQSKYTPDLITLF